MEVHTLKNAHLLEKNPTNKYFRNIVSNFSLPEFYR